LQIRVALNLEDIDDLLNLFDLLGQDLLVKLTCLELLQIFINKSDLLNDIIDSLLELSDAFSKLFCVFLDVCVGLPLNL